MVVCQRLDELVRRELDAPDRGWRLLLLSLANVGDALLALVRSVAKERRI